MEERNINLSANTPTEQNPECCAPGAKSTTGKSKLGGALVAIGVSGAALSLLCCAAPFLLAGILTAIGLGFILNDAILMGGLVVFLGVAGFGFYLARRSSKA